MRKARIIVSLASATLLALLVVPQLALAGTYTWSLPTQFAGSNPDADSYGTKPWSYVDARDPSGLIGVTPPNAAPASFRALATSSAAIDGGLTGWLDSNDTNAFVARNNSGAAINSVPAGAVAMQAAADRVAGIGWTSPFAKPERLAITGTFTPACAGPAAPTWTLDQNGTAISTSSSSTTISATANVAAGGSVYLTIDYTGLYGATCATAVATLQIQVADNAKPGVTLASPAHGSLISGGQPTFAGAASTEFGTASKVTVRVWKGGSAAGTPAQTLTATRSGSGYSVPPAPPLPDGTYTAIAEQDDLATPADQGFSSPATFGVHNAPPTITLNSPGSKPLLTSTPTLTGTAGTAQGDSKTVYVFVFPGANTSQGYLRLVSGTRSASGKFSIPVTPALADGEYTAVAIQVGATGAAGTSKDETFSIKVNPPAVTLLVPVAGSNTSLTSPIFIGAAGNALGDSNTVVLSLYSGSSTRGKRIGTINVTRIGTRWAVRWNGKLKLGLYTAQAAQSDNAGHTTRTKAHTFLIVPPPTVIGPTVTMTRSGTASVPITCLAPASQGCTGNVLVLTRRNYQTTSGGPSGRLRVLFAYVTISGGQTLIIRRGVPTEVASVLRHHAPVQVTVTASLSIGGGAAKVSTAARRLRLG